MKNMKKLVGPTVVMVLCGALLYWSLPRIMHMLVGHPTVIVHVDAALAPTLQKSIESSCKSAFNPMSSTWLATIKHQFPVIGHIISSRENNIALIYIEAVPLIARINNQCIIDATGSIHALNTIAPEASAALHNISARIKSQEINHEFKQFMQTLPTEILEKYTVEWLSPYLIYLTAKDASYRCITRYDLITDTQKLATAECLAQLPQHSKKKLTIDLRFNKQIILNTNNVH